MNFIWLVIVGALSGIFAGMGMGGGTLLIPMLTLFFNVNQHTAQAINLISFIPMAAVALIVHIKNKLVVFKEVWIIIVFAVGMSILSALLANNQKSELLAKLFGGFIVLLGIYQFVQMYLDNKKEKAKTINNEE
jgi:uncharacterized membrane protein YfcA